MLFVILAIVVIILVVMLLKRVLHLRVDDGDFSEENDYLERRIKKDEEDK